MDAQRMKIQGCHTCPWGNYHVAKNDWLLSRFPTTLAVEDTMPKNAVQRITRGFQHVMTTFMFSNGF